jgi:hypothetical protein
MKPISFLPAFACLMFTGCVPFKVQVGRHTEGIVHSKDTGAPVAGAQVMYKGHSSTAVMTGEDGKFVLERATVTKWLVPIPADYFGWQWHPLKVRADGYQTLTLEQSPKEPVDPIQIELSPKK